MDISFICNYGDGVASCSTTFPADALQVEMTDPAQNFFIYPAFSYGDITVCFVLLTILALIFWRVLKDEFKK